MTAARAEVFANRPAGTVSSGGTGTPSAGTAESWTVSVTAAFAAISGAQHFYAADRNSPGEVFEVTACPGSTGSQSWTVLRGADGSPVTAHSAGFPVTQVASAATLRALTQKPWQFRPEDYGAKCDGALLYDVSMTNGSAALTTVGLPAPAAPALAHAGSGGTVAAGTYLVQVTYVNANGETTASSSASVTTSGSASTITVTSPAPWTSATGYYVYMTAAGGSAGTERRQQAPGSPTPLDVNFVLTAPPGTSGALASGLSNTSASAPFTSADVGKSVIIPGAGGFANGPLSTTISAFVSSSHVTLAANCTTSAGVTSNGGVYGTDDTAALQNCINAAVTYAQGSEQGIAEILLGNGIYCVAGAPSTAASGNAQLQIPYVNPESGPKVGLRITGAQQATGPSHWAQPNPPAGGSVLCSFYYSDTAFGFPQPSVLGGPLTTDFSNMRLTVDGLNILVPYRPCLGGLDLFGVGQADIKSFSYFAMARTLSAAGGWPAYAGGTSQPSAWQVFGYRSPTTGNNAQNDADRITVYGAYHGVIFSDHFYAASVKCVYCFAAATAGSQNNNAHHSSIVSLMSEVTSLPVLGDNSGVYGTANQALFVASLQVENADNIISDPGNLLYGEVHVEEIATSGVVAAGKNGGANIRLVWSGQALGAVASPPSVPSSTTAYVNQFWRDAVVIVSGGTVSAIAIDGKTTGLTSGPVFVRSGGTITLTYSSAPSWQWVLA